MIALLVAVSLLGGTPTKVEKLNGPTVSLPILEAKDKLGELRAGVRRLCEVSTKEGAPLSIDQIVFSTQKQQEVAIVVLFTTPNIKSSRISMIFMYREGRWEPIPDVFTESGIEPQGFAP